MLSYPQLALAEVDLLLTTPPAFCFIGTTMPALLPSAGWSSLLAQFSSFANVFV